MGQAGQQQLLGFPPALPACDPAQGWLILAKCGFNHGAAIRGIGQYGRLRSASASCAGRGHAPQTAALRPASPC